MKSITLIRHAETNANRESRWQGHSDSGLSDEGMDQLARLRRRFADRDPGLLVSSDLDRTMTTAAAIGTPTPDSSWREFSIGHWEGLTTEEVQERFPDEFQTFVSGGDVRPGGGDLMSDFRRRIHQAFEDLLEGLPEDGNATVVTHGGAIWSLLSEMLDVGRGAPMIPSHNTALTEIWDMGERGRVINVFNDASHLDRTSTQFGPEGEVVTFVRHGQSEGNVAGRWDGTVDSALTARGEDQARAAADVVPTPGTLVASPQTRAASTARFIGDPHGVEPIVDHRLREMAFGAWDGLTTDQIRDQFPSDYAAYGRGETEDPVASSGGESIPAVGVRMREALDDIAGNGYASPVVAVSHGAAIRALTLNVLGMERAGRRYLVVPRNTSMTSIVMANETPVLASYNIAPHLEG